VKLSLPDDEIRRFQLQRDSATFEGLKKKIDSFEIQLPLIIRYRDDEGDMITMSSDEELTDTMTMHADSPLRLFAKFGAQTAAAAGQQSERPQPSDEMETALQALFQGLGLPPAADLLENLQGMYTAAATASTESLGQPLAVHHGVTCDRSGMCPILGIRYKRRGEDYDLCQAEYKKLTPEEQAAFVAIDHPRGHCGGGRPCGWGGKGKGKGEYSSGGGKGGKGFGIAFSPFGLPMDCRPFAPAGPGGPCNRGERPEQPSSRFVNDVSIFDGTEVDANTAFTKIWRLRNNGSTTWPAGSSLTFVGGDQMSSDLTTPLPEGGAVAAGAEVDVAVQLVAPSQSGRYVGYWRLVGPHGRRFGQRIWAHIRVMDTSLPAQAPSAEEKEAAAAAVVREEGESHSDPPSAAAAGEVPAPAGSPAGSSIGSFDEVIDPMLEEALLLSLEDAAAAEAEAKGSQEVAATEVAAAEEDQKTAVVQTPPLCEGHAAATPPPLGTAQMSLEAAVLAGLAAMGFSNLELNAAALAACGPNLEACAMALASLSSDWAGSLQDLEEMGFADIALNSCLLLKHNGSVKRAVKELVQATR